ncbi:MAG TPA: pyridoxal phosphate-dependent aminotransferase, partial [Chloroflexota bacterium]|nr:pyridoxal phosphate-dependent aminotransferase [Chloroflexota bacterium]
MSKRAEVSPFLAMEILEEAGRIERAGADVVHMEVGEPDFDTPACVREAAERALRDGRTHYTSSLGLYELREAICEDYWNRYKVKVSPDQVMVTSGTSPALFLLYSVLLEPGDEVILSNPYYACYPNFITFADGVPVYVDAPEEDGYQLKAEAIAQRIGPRTKAIMINSPSNPTGVVLDADRMEAIAKLGPMVVSDEIYHGLVYEGKERSILEFTDRACVFNGFSKLYAMTGWRLGYIIAPPEIIRAMQKIQSNFFISAGDFVQRAGIAALREAGPDVERMRSVYAERLRFILDGVRGLGLEIPHPPTGAFYLLVNFRRYTTDSLSFAFDILRNAKVAVTPGVDFGS